MATKSKAGERIPQVIGHRGFKARYPENSMLSFQGAISAGAHALETDVHLTRDNVVVLSHVGLDFFFPHEL
jgi:glycerophosphoryl diester phosphodiesterase